MSEKDKSTWNDQSNHIFKDAQNEPGTEQIDVPPLGFGSDSVIAGRYTVQGEFPSRGSQADVYLCKDMETSDRVVVKVYRKNIQPKEEVIRILKENRHENLIRFLDFIDWGNRFIEVMEYAQGGDLSEMMPITEEVIVNEILPQVIEGINALHEIGIVHRDIKETNIFFKDKLRRVIGIADFGISSVLFGSQKETASASRSHHYAAPEISHRIITKKVDYYALGMTLLILLKGRSPFEGMNDLAISFYHNQKDIPLPEEASDRFNELISGLLVKRYEYRWGYEEVSRWIRGENVPVFRESRKDADAAEPTFYYKFTDTETATDVKSLGTMMLHNSEHAKRHIQKRFLVDALKNVDANMAIKLSDIIDTARSLDAAYVEVVYTLNPELPYRLMDGIEAKNPEELARLIDRDQMTWAASREQLCNGMLPSWLRAKGYNELAREWKKVAGRLT